MSNLSDMAARALRRDADSPAIEFEGRWIKWGELRAIADDVESALTASGVKAGDPVALVARNRPSAIAALLGQIARERTVKMVYPFQAASAIARDVASLAVSAIVADEEDMTGEIKAALAERGLAAVALGASGARALAGLQYKPTPASGAAREAPRIEILTSGTTGPPKRFVVSHDLIEKHFVANSSLVARAGDPASAPPFLLYFPLGNITGLYSTVPMLIHGLRVILLQRFSLEAWLDYVVRYRPVHTGVPPSYVQQIVDADIAREDLASIQAMGVGAAPLPPSAQKAFEDKYAIPILISYGATEFGGPVSAMTLELHAQYGREKLGTVGRPIGDAKVRAIDAATGQALAPGQEGLLEVVAPRIGPDWIRTSDLGRVDEDGFVFISGRADAAIMRGGFKILPETVERALLLHPAVSEASVVGIADERLGETPAAAVRLKPGGNRPSTADLMAHLREHLLATHLPAHWVFVPELPRTPSLKVDRAAVARLFQSAPRPEGCS